MRTSVRECLPGSAYSRFQRALTTGNLQLIQAAAAGLPKVSLEDALAILIVLAQRQTVGSGARGAVGGAAAHQTPANLSDARFALALVERLPSCRDALHGLAGPAVRSSPDERAITLSCRPDVVAHWTRASRQ